MTAVYPLTDEELDQLGLPEQALYVMSHFGYMTPERFVLLVLATYNGDTLERLVGLTGMTLPTVRKHLRLWERHGVVELSGTSKDATATFLGARAWLATREAAR